MSSPIFRVNLTCFATPQRASVHRDNPCSCMNHIQKGTSSRDQASSQSTILLTLIPFRTCHWRCRGNRETDSWSRHPLTWVGRDTNVVHTSMGSVEESIPWSLWEPATDDRRVL